MSYSNNEYIKLNRKMLEWRWFTDVNTAHFFVYCLLSANWKEGCFKDKKVERGQFIRTYANMSAESGLSIQNIRTAIKHLKLTGEITVNLTGNGRSATLLITVVKYDDYQQANTKDNTLSNNQLTTNQHESNTKVTQIEEVKKIRSKEVKKELSNDNSISPGEIHHKKICDKWNTLKDLGVQGLRSITPNSKREINLKARLKEFGEDSFDEIIEHFKISKFLQGKATDFKPDFDWVILPSNYQKVLEGRYDDDRHDNKSQQQSFNMEDFLRGYE